MTTYVDTSAAAKLILTEPESDALSAHLQGRTHRRDLVSSYLLHAELYCAAARRSNEIPLAAVHDVLSTIELVDLDRADLLAAPGLPGRLRAADAIHLATALRVRADRIVVYDEELSRAASAVGLHVEAPGRT